MPGTPGLEHRIGGLEKADGLGNVSYDPENHHRMSLLRAEKIDRIARDIPPLDMFGADEGDLLILGWGCTYGAIRQRGRAPARRRHSVAHAHLRYLNPFPANLGDVLRRYRAVLVPELNLGQLSRLIRDAYLVDAIVVRPDARQAVPDPGDRRRGEAGPRPDGAPRIVADRRRRAGRRRPGAAAHG